MDTKIVDFIANLTVGDVVAFALTWAAVAAVFVVISLIVGFFTLR